MKRGGHNPRGRSVVSWCLCVAGLLVAGGCGTTIIAPPGPPPPVADAGPNQSVAPGATVVLNGNQSVDPNGGPLTYAWSQLVGPPVQLVDQNTPSATFLAPNENITLTFQLIVTDQSGVSSSASTSVFVGNQPPVANAGTSLDVVGGSLVTLNGSGSTDPDGDPLTYTWTQISGQAVAIENPTSPTPTFIAPNANATLVFQLAVSDGKGGNSSATVDVRVTPGTVTTNTPPIANAGPPQSATGGQTVVLDGSASRDPDGDPISFLWTQVSGTLVNLLRNDIANPIFVAPNTNTTLIFDLTVSDGRGGTSRSQTSVTVNPSGGSFPF